MVVALSSVAVSTNGASIAAGIGSLFILQAVIVVEVVVALETAVMVAIV